MFESSNSDVNLFILVLLEQCSFLISSNISRFLLCQPTNFVIALETAWKKIKVT